MEEGEAEGGNWGGLSPEVLDMIFQHLPVPDLLSCSVLSKNWKKAARDVLKRSRECYAHVKYFPEDIQDLNEMIASTDIMEMINGLHIRNESRPGEDCRSQTLWLWHHSSRRSYGKEVFQSVGAEVQLEEAKQKILDVLCGEWRYLDLDMGFGFRHFLSRDNSLLLRETILATSGTLQKLVVGQDRDWQFIPCSRKPFPKLKVIQAQQELAWDFCLSKLAPNLEEITGAMMRLDVVFGPVDRFKLERMKSVRVDEIFAVPQGEAREIFRCVSGLYRLDLPNCHYRADDEDPDDQGRATWNAFVFPFVLRSSNTLKDLGVCAHVLYSLAMVSDGLEFPNLRRLSLATHGSVPMSNEISALKTLNFPKIFPKLEQLELKEANCSVEVEEVVIPLAEQGLLDQSHTPVAVDLICQDGLYDHEHLEFVNTIYPKMRKVRILKLKNVVDYDISKIFWDVQSLECLEINVLPPPYEVEFGIEALLCGIHVEEAHLHWLKFPKQEDKLSSCTVPIRPSLLNSINLKELKISEDIHNFVRDPDLARCSWVTQLTENLPERHLRNLKVIFDGSKGLYDRLSSMRSFTWLRENMMRDTYVESIVRKQ